MKRVLRKRRESARQRLGLRQPSAALKTACKCFDTEIEIGSEQLRRGEKIPGALVYAEIQELSRQKRLGGKG